MRTNEEVLELLVSDLIKKVQKALENESVIFDCRKYTNERGFTGYTIFIESDNILQGIIKCDDEGYQLSYGERTNPRILKTIRRTIY